VRRRRRADRCRGGDPGVYCCLISRHGLAWAGLGDGPAATAALEPVMLMWLHAGLLAGCVCLPACLSACLSVTLMVP
jgi:hypothetical protein